MLTNKIFLNASRTIAGYALAGITIILLEKSGPSGPCAPGLGMFAFLLLIPVSLILCVVTAFRAIEKDSSHWISAAIHMIVLLLIYLYSHP